MASLVVNLHMSSFHWCVVKEVLELEKELKTPRVVEAPQEATEVTPRLQLEELEVRLAPNAIWGD